MINNLFVFHGADHKCGTTMLAQSTAELIAAKNKGINVLLLSLSGRKGVEYVMEKIDPIDAYKLQLDSGISVDKQLIAKNKFRDNLYMIAGIEREAEQRYYLPETAVRLLEDTAEQFRIIIADTGSEIDNGLAVGGLSSAAKKFLVMTQNESAVKRYENQREFYAQINMGFDFCIVNKYCGEDPHTLKYISERLGKDRNSIYKVEMADYGRQAEMEYRTLLEYRQDKYSEDIVQIANIILQNCQMEKIYLRRKVPWKSFI